MNEVDPDCIAEALTRAVAGDDVALAELLAVHVCPAIARSISRSGHLGSDRQEDLVQDAMVRILRGLPLVHARTPRQLAGWCLAVARRIAFDHERQRKRDPLARAQSDLDEVAQLAAEPEPATDVVSRALARAVRRAISDLPRETRVLMDLRVGRGATWPEIAAELRIAPSAAKRRYQRAQARLRARILEEIRGLPARQRIAASARIGVPPS